MTSGIVPPVARPSEPHARLPGAQCGSFIDKRLRQTRRQVKSVDIWARLITLAAGTLAYLLAATLIDHWLIPGGLGFWGRLVLFAGLLTGAGFYLAIFIAPLVIRRVNPIFAAYSIEESRPSLKNSLINLLYLRRDRNAVEQDDLARGIYQALERKAAADLAQIPAETAVDRSLVIRLGCFLAAILAVCCLYLALSPKSPLASFGRVFWPWADIKAPTRVAIDDVRPGDQLVYQGDLVTASAAVRGLARDEPVILYYSTADGQSVDQAVPMLLAEGSRRHSCDLPPGRFGLQQDMEYYLAAGDCRTRRFKLEVRTAPSILVDDVEYDYPEYTGLPHRIDRRVADLKAIEGTRVTVRATANHQIERAFLEMDGDPRRALRMTIENPRAASARLTLIMDPNDPATPLHESYQLRFTDKSGRQNRLPIRHRIEVIRDLPPEISLVDPPPEQIELPEDGVLELQIRAQDPDFALRRVALRAECDERPLGISPLLDKPRPETPHQGPFEAKYRFEPARLGLKAGDKVIYWAEAEDNMFWEAERERAWLDAGGARATHRWPNRSETARRWITVVPPDRRLPPAQPPDAAPKPPKQRPDEEQKQVSQQPEERQPQPAGAAGQDEQLQIPADQQPGQPEEPESRQSEDESQKPADQQQPGQEGGDQQSGTAGGNSQSQQPGGKPDQEDSQQQTSPQQQEGPGGTASETGQGNEKSSSQEPGQASEGGTGTQQADGHSPRREPIDGQTNPGDAFEQILRHLDEQKTDTDSSRQADSPNGQQGQPQADGQRPGQPQGTASSQSGKQQGEQNAASQAQQTPQEQVTEPQPGQGADRPGASESNQTGESGKEPGDRQQAQQGGTGSSGAKQADEQKAPDNAPVGSQGTGARQQAEDGQGAQSKGLGEPTREEPSAAGEERLEARGGDPQQTKGEGGAGRSSEEDAASPSPQERNQQRAKQSGEGDQSEPDEGDSAQSPSISPKDSDSQGDTSGTRSGGGEEGGGQKSKQSGTGTAGTHTASEQGGSQSDQQGEGPTGTGAGDQVEAERPTGHPAEEGQGPGSGQREQPGAQHPGEQPQRQQQPTPESDGQSDAGQPTDGQTRAHDLKQERTRSSGNPTMGGRPGDQPIEPGPPKPGTYHGDDANLEYTRKATDLALEYLEDQLAKDQPDQGLLDRLGWTNDDLERFYREWDARRRDADRQGPGSERARQELDKALQSLGLRPRGVESRGGQRQSDTVGDLKEALRIPPPPEWAEAYRAFKMGVAGGDE